MPRMTKVSQNTLTHSLSLVSCFLQIQTFGLLTLTLLLLLDENDENKIYEMYSQEEVENFRMIFIMFDTDKTGFVGINDL